MNTAEDSMLDEIVDLAAKAIDDGIPAKRMIALLEEGWEVAMADKLERDRRAFSRGGARG